jgi:hypothetical protein
MTFSVLKILMMTSQISSRPHDSDQVQERCFQRGCWIQLLPPHSNDQTQPCDVGVFGPMKTNMARTHPARDLSKQSKEILKILAAMQ